MVSLVLVKVNSRSVVPSSMTEAGARESVMRGRRAIGRAVVLLLSLSSTWLEKLSALMIR